MKKIYVLLIALGLAGVGYLLVGGGLLTPAVSTPRSIYYADNISPAHQAVIDRFNALHKGAIEVIPVNLPFEKFTTNERKELLARSLRNKSDRIDVFSVDLIWVSRFSKWSEPLDEVIGREERDNILGSALESCYADGALVAVPLYLDIGMMYYRRDILQRLPDWQEVENRLKESVTWEEFLALRDRLGYRDHPYYAYPAKDYEGLVCNYFEMLAGQQEGPVDNHSMRLTGKAPLTALRMMVDFVRREAISPPEVTEFDENRCYDFMLTHDGVFWRGWPNFLENYRSFFPDTAKLGMIGRAALPHFAGRPPRSVFGGWNLMISKYSTGKPQAMEFIRFLQSEEAQKTLFRMGGYLPANRKVYDDTTFMRQHPDLVYYRHLLDRGFHRPALKEYTRISDVISHYVHRAITGELTPDEALRSASRMINAPRFRIE